MGQALYRRYRSRSFDDVVGQDHIIKTLRNALDSGRVSHAYLFTGPRGVGKTSVARILAHEVNSLDYSDETIHLDIVEIDAASNRRIDEIRDLREKVRVAPAAAKYKVYIIDEVHMLTKEAFNALLKTLEEPPAHVIFILATTEAHKLPETIISRTQRFEFKPISGAQAAKHLGDIAKREKIDISPEALILLAEFGNGSFRDSISYLDQLSSLGGKIDEDSVRSILGLPTARSIDELLELISTGDSGALLNKLIQIEETGVNPVSAAAALSTQLRGQALAGRIDKSQIKLLKRLSQVSAHSRPQEALEIALLESIYNDTTALRPKDIPKAAAKRIPEPEPKPADATGTTSSFSLSQWDAVLSLAKAEAASIYTALRLADPAYDNGVLSLAFQFPLHQKKLAQAKNKDLVSKLVKQVSGSDVLVELAVVQRAAPNPAPEIQNETPPSAIHSIFGAAEVMEA